MNIKSKGDREKLSVEEYLIKIKPYLKNLINNLEKSDTWKIQSRVTSIFISSKCDYNEECVMHSKSDNHDEWWSIWSHRKISYITLKKM